MELAFSHACTLGDCPLPYGSLSPRSAAAYLQDERICARNFGQTLRNMYPHEDLFERLFSFYRLSTPDAHPNSLERRIKNWLAGRNQPTNREDLFRIAFALSLNEVQLDTLLGLTTDYCIQYRSGRELVCAWFLRTGRTYQEALAFYDSLPAYKAQESMQADMHTHVTRELKNELATIVTIEELRSYYLHNMSCFGNQHLRSYFYFDRYLTQLVHPTTQAPRDESYYSIERVMSEYLSMKVPFTRRRSDYTVTQRLIKQGWPNATTIKSVRNHTKDVPRKLLLLLYIVTENCGILDDMVTKDKESITLAERVEDHWWILNAILVDCGMAPLDPRNAFDWLTLYAIAASPHDHMNDRMEQVISYVFQND